MTTSDKLTYIRGNCLSQIGCENCNLTLGLTCPRKNWGDWTDEEIETAYAILFYHTPSYAEEQLEHAIKKDKEERKRKFNAIVEYCGRRGKCIGCPLEHIGLAGENCLDEKSIECNYDLIFGKEPEKQKIRTHFAEIKLGGTPKKPYFSIYYYDPTDNEYHEGFGSYEFRNVEGWLRDEFEIVNEPPEKETEFVKVGDSVEHPTHYTQNGIECIEAIKASMTADGFMDYCKGNVLKYIWRWRDKGGVEDLEKARVYLGWMIEEAYKEGEN